VRDGENDEGVGQSAHGGEHERATSAGHASARRASSASTDRPSSICSSTCLTL
jgi:hypothetical protein